MGVSILFYPGGKHLADRPGSGRHAPDLRVCSRIGLRRHPLTPCVSKLRSTTIRLPGGCCGILSRRRHDQAMATTARTTRRSMSPALDVMSQLSIPALHLDLPIFHGVAPDTLMKGAGHLPGSSVPVGGPGTHAVVTAHSGLANATMFTELDRLEVGDFFEVTTLNKRLRYEVEEILIVKPDDISSLQITDEGDYVTLITCTPININSHRLLVRGSRIPIPEAGRCRSREESRSGVPLVGTRLRRCSRCHRCHRVPATAASQNSPRSTIALVGQWW